jgi:sugar O-acyltransferase (sialic acid O-acetyltransferase NeuD family)
MSAATPLCAIFGAGGHAKVLIDCLERETSGFHYVLLDSNPSLWGTNIMGVQVVGDDSVIPELISDGATHFVVGLGGTRSLSTRPRVFDRAIASGLRPMTVCHPSSLVSSWARIGEGCQLLPRSVVNTGAVLGVGVILNTGAIVEHDSRVGDHSHIASGAVVLGAVHIGPLAHIGAGAVLRQGVEIGEGATVGAGSVVVSHIPSGQVYAGAPARPLRGGRADSSQRIIECQDEPKTSQN